MLYPPFRIEVFSSSPQHYPADAAFLTPGNVFQSFLKKIIISIFFENLPFSSQERPKKD